MDIILYNNNAEKVVLNKLPYLHKIIKISGTLREQCSLINPSIIVNLNPSILSQALKHQDYVLDDDSDYTIDDDANRVILTVINQVLSCNYVYISEFNRYYFVDNITSVNKDLWRIDMSVDVLMSFKDEIKTQKGLIARNENEYDDMIIDKLESFEQKPTIDITEFDNDSETLGFQEDAGQGTLYNQYYFVTILTTYEPYLTGVLSYVASTPGVYGLPEVKRAGTNLLGTTITYIMKFGDVYNLYKHARENDLLSWIQNISLIPLENSSIINRFTDESYGTIPVNTSIPLGTNLAYYTRNVSYFVLRKPYLPCFTLHYNPTDLNFLYLSPCSNYQILVPYLGYIDVDSKDVIGKTLKIVYTYDPITGDSQVIVLSENRPIYTSACQLGSNFNMTADNSYQNQILRRQTVLNMVTGTIGGVSQVVGGAVTAGTVGGQMSVESGISRLASSIVSGINTLESIRTKASATCTSGASGNQFPMKAHLRRVYQDSLLNTDEKYDNFRKLYGMPLNQVKTLSDLTGFTVVDDIHLENIPTATSGEIDAIYTLLKNGIIL